MRPMTEPIVRTAEAADVSALAELRRRSTEEEEEEEEGTGTGDPDFEAAFARWYAKESRQRITWVADLDGALVGMVNLLVFDRMPRPGKRPAQWGYLANAFVLPTARNRGIGTRLLDAVLVDARERSLARVVLSPSPRSVTSIVAGASARPTCCSPTRSASDAARRHLLDALIVRDVRRHARGSRGKLIRPRWVAEGPSVG